jgi:hypothetical protein
MGGIILRISTSLCSEYTRSFHHPANEMLDGTEGMGSRRSTRQNERLTSPPDMPVTSSPDSIS